MRQKRRSRDQRDLLEGVSAKGAGAASPAQCALPRTMAARQRAEIERLMTIEQEAEIERLLDDLTTILLEAEMMAHPDEPLPEESLSLARLEMLRTRRRCGEA